LDFLDVLGITSIMEGLKKRVENALMPYKTEQVSPKRYIYRPQNLDELIGQENTKERLKLIIQKNQRMKPTHVILSGTKGCGKSTIAMILGEELGFTMNYYIGGAFTLDNLRKFIVKNQDDNIPNVLFLDEIHATKRDVIEYLYPILEDFILPEGKNVKLRPFVFIGATTDKNVLIKKYSPLIDRCEDVILEQYTIEDIKQIIIQYNDKLYQRNIEEEIYNIIAQNTRFTPRIAIQWLEDLVICEDIQKIMMAHRVIKNGITFIDKCILQHLADVGKPVGIEALAMIAGVTREDYNYVIEPYILSQGYISRTAKGRILTLKGKEFLQKEIK